MARFDALACPPHSSDAGERFSADQLKAHSFINFINFALLYSCNRLLCIFMTIRLLKTDIVVAAAGWPVER